MRIAAALCFSILVCATAARAEDDTMAFMQKFNEELTKYRGKTKITTQAAGTLAQFSYCTVKKVGMKATWALYQDIRAVERQAHQMCRSKQEEAAKTYVISEFISRQNDPAVQAAVGCFESYQGQLATVIHNPTKAALLPSYVRWARNPSLARTEMSAHTLCH